ncbi:MAG: hypothetical protein QM488_05135 [Rhizobiaceae bacterium]
MKQRTFGIAAAAITALSTTALADGEFSFWHGSIDELDSDITDRYLGS